MISLQVRGTFTGGDMENFIGMEMHCINDVSFGKELPASGYHNCEFVKGSDGHHNENEKCESTFLVKATNSINVGVELSIHHMH